VQSYLTIWDLVLTPIYLFILHYIAKTRRDRLYPVGHPLRQYYMAGLWVKFAGAIFIALIYQFYYGFGDTFNYFAHAKIINSSLSHSVTDWFNLLRQAPVEQHPTLYNYTSQMFWYNESSSYLVCVIGAVLGLFSGTTYIPIALLFAFISYTGIWAMYKTFADIYPHLQKYLAYAFLFIPSTFVWGSAIFKDTVCMFGLGWMVYTSFRIFIHKDFSVKNLFLLALSFYLVATIKVYILLAFIPALAFWIMLNKTRKIQSGVLKFAFTVFISAVVIGGFLLFSRQFSNELNRYSLENIAKTSESTRTYIGYVSEKEGGSAYDLGEFDGSAGSMAAKLPAAVVVTLFRPFPWEAGKFIVLLSSAEALIFLFFTLRAFYKNGVGKSLKFIINDPNTLFCLVFAVIFAFAVGISTYNFGALSRYKIPCLPFYGCFLVLLLYKNQKQTVPIQKKPAPALAGI
jgi:hypothetical protein